MKFHKQRDLIILISKHFDFFLIGPVFTKLLLVEISSVPIQVLHIFL